MTSSTSNSALGVDSTNNNTFDILQFEQLLDRLEASKQRQQRQKSVEGRRDIFATKVLPVHDEQLLI
jgi:hypothetical protein